MAGFGTVTTTVIITSWQCGTLGRLPRVPACNLDYVVLLRPEEVPNLRNMFGRSEFHGEGDAAALTLHWTNRFLKAYHC